MANAPMSKDRILEAIRNEPTARALTDADQAYIDAWTNNPANIVIETGAQLADLSLFDDVMPGVVNMHVIFSSRGKEAITSAKEAIAAVFATTPVHTILACVPANRRDVNMLARWTGFKFIEQVILPEGPSDMFLLSRNNWDEM